jgi:hypothetical protein
MVGYNAADVDAGVVALDPHWCIVRSIVHNDDFVAVIGQVLSDDALYASFQQLFLQVVVWYDNR